MSAPWMVICCAAATMASYGTDKSSMLPHSHKDAIAATRVVEESIGVATMEADGTIVLRLIARGPGGLRGEGVLRYPVDRPKYQEILDHVGPLKPGELRPVAPWPD